MIGPEDLPPPYQQGLQGNVATVNCRVCQCPIDVSGKRDQHVVKCAQCNEATVSLQIRFNCSLCVPINTCNTVSIFPLPFSANTESSSWQEIRSVSLQLFADMQINQPEDCLPSAQLQEDYKSVAISSDAAYSCAAWHVQS